MKKDPHTLTHAELEELSKKKPDELSEGEKEALAKSRFYGYYDKSSMSEETWENLQELARVATKAHEEKDKGLRY